jgi:large subunit ribosomal protein L9
MKVIMKKTRKVQDVNDGYARNYLLPKGLAELATKEGVQKADAQQKKQAEEQRQQESTLREWASKLSGVTVQLSAAANADGTLFGALKESAILDGLQAQHQITLQREWLHMGEPIKHVGTYTMTVKLPNKIQTTFSLNLVKQ